jgi:hypothetical protein
MDLSRARNGFRVGKRKQDPPRGMLQARAYAVRDQDRALVAECPFCGASITIPLGLAAGQGEKPCACGATLRGGSAKKRVGLRITASERRALRLFRDHEARAATRVHGLTRHALERKGLLRGRTLTALGRAALAPPPGVPDIFDDLFPQKKEA